jgi:hypothetical protein
MKKLMLPLIIFFVFFSGGINASEKELQKLEDLQSQFKNLKVLYVLEQYPKYHSELSKIRQKLLEIKNLKNEEGWMRHLALSSIEKLMYIYNTEDILFSLIPSIKDSGIQSFCDFVISHNQHDRKELNHDLQIIQVTFDSIHQSEVLHELDKVKRIISDSLELLDMTDGIVTEYKAKHKKK